MQEHAKTDIKQQEKKTKKKEEGVGGNALKQNMIAWLTYYVIVIIFG